MIKFYKKFGWCDTVLVLLFGGYMGYVFILALANTICDCI